MTPEQEEQVRQALAAAARVDRPDTERVPPQVASRLDEVLAELVAGRTARTGSVPAAPGSDELAARRARKWREGLVAAAAVAVIAVAGGAVATRGFGGSGGGASSAGSATQQDRVTPGSGTPSAGTPSAGEPRLRSASLAADVQRVVDAAPAGSFGSGESLAGPGARTDGATCAMPASGRGAALVAVRLDGKPATLVLAPAADGTREARVYSCADGSTPVATTSVRQR